MKKTEKNLYMLYMLFGVALVTANCIASKIIVMPFNLFGAPVTVTVGIISYPFTFLVTDIISEIWGKEKAQHAVRFGFICQIVSTAMVILARYLPAADPDMQNHYVALLGQTWTFVLASLVAYSCSQRWDVFVFHKIRNAYIEKHGSTRGGKWIWNNVGTITSQLLDSVIYAGIAFGFGFGWFFNPEMGTALVNMILAQWLIKSIVAVLDTPIFYWCTRGYYGD